MQNMVEEMFLSRSYDPPWRNHYCKHLDTGEKFRFMAGGFSWPGLEPGFAVALGVSYEDHPTEKVPVLYCLGEVEENDISKLIEESIRLGQEYMVSSWYGDTESLLRESLYPINRDQREVGHREFWLISAPNIRHPDHFGYHARLIGENLKAGEKLLFLGNCSKLKGHLSEFSKEAAAKGSSGEYPAVAALGCVVASIRTYRPWEYYGYKDPGPIPPLDPIVGF